MIDLVNYQYILYGVSHNISLIDLKLDPNPIGAEEVELIKA